MRGINEPSAPAEPDGAATGFAFTAATETSWTVPLSTVTRTALGAVDRDRLGPERASRSAARRVLAAGVGTRVGRADLVGGRPLAVGPAHLDRELRVGVPLPLDAHEIGGVDRDLVLVPRTDRLARRDRDLFDLRRRVRARLVERDRGRADDDQRGGGNEKQTA